MYMCSLQAGRFPSILRGVPMPQGHGWQRGCAGEPGASSLQPGQLGSSGLHVELGAASSIQSDGVYSAAGRTVVGRGRAPNLNFDFWSLCPTRCTNRGQRPSVESLRCCHHHRHADIAFASTSEVDPFFFFCYCFRKDSLNPSGSNFGGKKQKQKKRKTKQKKQLFLSTEEKFWYQMTILHVCKAWFMFLIVICCITKHWKFHKPFAICSFVLYCLFYASPVDNCV